MSANEEILLEMHPPATQVVAANKAVDVAIAAARLALKEARAKCQHPVQFRCDYEPSRSGLFNAMPPLLQCAHCLLERSEWSGASPLGPTLDKTTGEYRNPTIIDISRDAMMARRVEGSGGIPDVERDDG